jgi:hypothetical protein
MDHIGSVAHHPQTQGTNHSVVESKSDSAPGGSGARDATDLLVAPLP